MAIYEAYEHYYGSSLYDSRYPRPNRRTLGLVRSAAPAGSTIVDIGAGNGRYALVLARMGYSVVAVERSEIARAQMHERVLDARLGDVIGIHADLSDVPPETLAGAGTAMLLFGVLGHMSFEERTGILTTLSAGLSPSARLLGSVPNRYRRFRHEQRTSRIADPGASPRFRYTRGAGDDEVTLEYTAFSPAELQAELVECGWCCCDLSPESILPEALVTSHARLGAADALVSSVLPAAAGYCIYYEATNHGRHAEVPAATVPEAAVPEAATA
jgi:tRNA (uracil-5-)-methyltransferase TRM9